MFFYDVTFWQGIYLGQIDYIVTIWWHRSDDVYKKVTNLKFEMITSVYSSVFFIMDINYCYSDCQNSRLNEKKTQNLKCIKIHEESSLDHIKAPWIEIKSWETSTFPALALAATYNRCSLYWNNWQDIGQNWSDRFAVST